MTVLGMRMKLEWTNLSSMLSEGRVKLITLSAYAYGVLILSFKVQGWLTSPNSLCDHTRLHFLVSSRREGGCSSIEHRVGGGKKRPMMMNLWMMECKSDYEMLVVFSKHF